MIWINSIDEYVSLQTIQNYCNSQNECEGKCPLFPLCCCMSKEPSDWCLEYCPPKKDEGNSKREKKISQNQLIVRNVHHVNISIMTRSVVL